MPSYEHGSPELGRVHRRNNDKKWFCHFTGFLEGVLASGYIESGEIEPLIAECVEFFERVKDRDANDILEDFKADLLEHAALVDCVEYRLDEIDPSCPKSSANRFLGFLRGIAADGRILFREAQEICSRLEEEPALLNTTGVREVFRSCKDAVQDGEIDSEEEKEISKFIGELVGDAYGDTGLSGVFGVANFHEYIFDDAASELRDATIVLTGEFEDRPRRIFEEVLSEFGAIIAKSVSAKTDFLVVGGEASRDWIEQNRGLKMRKAQALHGDTGRPKFVSEAQLKRKL